MTTGATRHPPCFRSSTRVKCGVETKGFQSMAISAMPLYVALADRFVICAPDALHRDTGQSCTFETYRRRGWCRAEMLAKVCTSGTQHVYLQADAVMCPRLLPEDNFDLASWTVFDGEFSVCHDAEQLTNTCSS